MEAHFPEEANNRLMNLMTIARNDQSAANDAALVRELKEGKVMLLVPAEPPTSRREGVDAPVVFTHVVERDGERCLLAFTSEAAVRRFAAEDLVCLGVPANDLLRVCMGGIDVIVLDPNTPNEVCVCLTPDEK
ncbi:MAG: SseB family protein [Flavobacteriales bacterium]